MAVGICYGVPREVHLANDSPHYIFVSENALVGQQRESPCLCVAHHATAKRLLVFKLAGCDAFLLEQGPNLQMAAGIGQVVAVWLCFAQRSAVDDQLATDQPKDADMRLLLPTLCWRVSLGGHPSFGAACNGSTTFLINAFRFYDPPRIIGVSRKRLTGHEFTSRSVC
jgi:hypothetical protein